MTTLVMAHGGHDPGQKKLRVPSGTTIDFYADFDENMIFVNGLAVVARGDLGAPNQSYGEGEEIPNYYYQALTSDQLGWYLQLDRSGLEAWFVGNDLPNNTYLCNTYDDCDAWGANDGSGYHSCSGVLGKAKEAGESHLVVLACRGDMTKAGDPQTRALVDDAGGRDTSHIDDMDAEVTTFSGLDRAAQETRWNGYPENTKLLFMGYPWMKGWAEAYGAKALITSDGPQAFATYYGTLEPAAKQHADADPATAPALQRARALDTIAYIEADPAAAATWFDSLGKAQKDDLLADNGIRAWNAGRGSDAAAADTSWAPTEGDIANVTTANQTFVKAADEDVDHPWEAGGFLVLLGDGHDGSFSDWVRTRPDHASGTFQLERATFGAGKIVFSGVPGSHQATVTWAVEQFSDKKVKFE